MGASSAFLLITVSLPPSPFLPFSIQPVVNLSKVFLYHIGVAASKSVPSNAEEPTDSQLDELFLH